MKPPPLSFYVLCAFGVTYLLRPEIFFTLLSSRKAPGERRVMSEQNKTFMRLLGVTFLIAAVVILLRAPH
jgi:hypothetical protein